MRLSAVPLALVLGTFLLAGCGDDGYEPDSAVPTPTAYEQCNVWNDVGEKPASSLKAHWLEDRHGFDEEASLFVCVFHPGDGGVVTVTAPQGVEVTPSTAPINRAGTGVMRFGVSASPGASGRLRLDFANEGGGGDVTGARVESDNDGWSLKLGD